MKDCSQRGPSCSSKIRQSSAAARHGRGPGAPPAARAPPALRGAFRWWEGRRWGQREPGGHTGVGPSLSLFFIPASSHLKAEPAALAPKWESRVLFTDSGRRDGGSRGVPALRQVLRAFPVAVCSSSRGCAREPKRSRAFFFLRFPESRGKVLPPAAGEDMRAVSPRGGSGLHLLEQWPGALAEGLVTAREKGLSPPTSRQRAGQALGNERRAPRCPRWPGDKPGPVCVRATLSLEPGAVNGGRTKMEPAPHAFYSLHKINSIYSAPWQVLNSRCFMPVAKSHQ